MNICPSAVFVKFWSNLDKTGASERRTEELELRRMLSFLSNQLAYLRSPAKV